MQFKYMCKGGEHDYQLHCDHLPVCLSVCPTIHMGPTGSHLTDFCEIARWGGGLISIKFMFA